LNTPHNKRLAAAAISSSKNSFNAGGIALRRSRNVRPRIFPQSKSLCTIIRTQKSHTQKHKIGFEKSLRIGYLSVRPLTLLILVPV
jgi:hypothetical protein